MSDSHLVNKKSSKANHYTKNVLLGTVGALGLFAVGAQSANAATITVKQGDTIWDFAQKYGVSISEIEAQNSSIKKVSSSIDLIYSGQQLQLSGHKAAAQSSVAKTVPTDYVVKSGDTLSSVANRFNVSVAQLIKANGIQDSNFILVGQRLSLTGTKNVASASTVSDATVSSAVATSEAETVTSSAVAATTSSAAVTTATSSSVVTSSATTATSSSNVGSSSVSESFGNAATSTSTTSTSVASSSTASAVSNNVAVSSSATSGTTAATSVATNQSSSAVPNSSNAQATASSSTQSSVASSSQAATSSSHVVASSSVVSSAVASSSASTSQTTTSSSAATTNNDSQATSSSSNSNLTSGSVVSLAVKLASANIPYVWGGNSLSGMDCSGLVQYVFKNADGVTLPHNTVAQEAYVAKHSVASAQPGDILFWGTPGSTYHDAIYIGNNQYVAAPSTGKNVQVQTISKYFMPSFAGTLK